MNKSLLLAALVGATFVACASLGSPEDQSEAEGLWDRISGYQSWGQAPGFEGVQPSKSVHGDFVRVYVNDVVAADLASPGFGSILVKEGFDKADASKLKALTVMERIEGYDPENDDWFWARYKPDGTLTDSGQVSNCIKCHRADAEDFDYVFVND